METNVLYYGDNLEILRKYIPSNSIDLIYLDPPFNSKATYNVLFKEPNGRPSQAQITAFDDTWTWGMESEKTFREIVGTAPAKVVEMMSALHSFIGTNDMMAYLVMMCIRLIELRRVLRDTGSIYLHCDPTASHYIKLLMDAVFGGNNFRNEIVWHYTGGGRSKTYFSSKHDTIFLYSKGDVMTFNIDEVRVPYKETSGYAKGGIVSKAGKLYLPHPKGTPVDDVWDIPIINPMARERTGYQTQKPKTLLERIIKASSNDGDLVLDPFCGCGTTVVAAQSLKRKWIGIDITYLAIGLMEWRLKNMVPMPTYKVIGEPEDLTSAVELANKDKYQFQWWAVSRIGGQPYGDKKKGADTGIDGYLYFMDEKDKIKKAIISVKGGSTSVKDIRDLSGVIDRPGAEGSEIGIFITLKKPTKPMKIEAVKKGFYRSPFTGRDYPRIQIITIEELLGGAKLDIPSWVAPIPSPTRAKQESQPIKML